MNEQALIQTFVNIGLYIYHNWAQIALYSVNGLSLAVIVQWIKRHFKLDEIERIKFMKLVHLDGPRIVSMMFLAFSGLDTAATWLADPSNSQYVPVRYAFIVTAGIVLHRFLVSPTSKRIEKSLEPYMEAVSQLKAEQVASAQAPLPPLVTKTSDEFSTPKEQAPLTAPVTDIQMNVSPASPATTLVPAPEPVAALPSVLPPSLSPYEAPTTQG